MALRQQARRLIRRTRGRRGANRRDAGGNSRAARREWCAPPICRRRYHDPEVPARGLVQRLIITRVPVLIGEGIPLFGSLPHDLHLSHITTQHYPSGLVKSEYQVVPNREYNSSRGLR